MSESSDERERVYQWHIEGAEMQYLIAIRNGIVSPVVFVCDLHTEAGKTIARTQATAEEVATFVQKCERDEVLPTIIVTLSTRDAQALFAGSEDASAHELLNLPLAPNTFLVCVVGVGGISWRSRTLSTGA